MRRGGGWYEGGPDQNVTGRDVLGDKGHERDEMAS